MIELDIINQSDNLRFYIEHIWPKDYMLYIYDEGEHYRLQCDSCCFWDGNYTLTLNYDDIALIRICLYKGNFEQVRNVSKNKRRIYQ